MWHYLYKHTETSVFLAFMLVAACASPSIGEEIGVTAATNPVATGEPPGQSVRELKIGLNIVRNERIRTTVEGATQVIFVDRTSLTIGPNSDITIDEYIYNPNANNGSLAIRMGNGVLRFIGGQISHGDQIRITTPTATLGIRGGMALVNSTNGKTIVVHLYGTTIVTTRSSSVTLSKPGFYTETTGTRISPPNQAPPGLLTSLNVQLASRPGQTGGAPPGLVTGEAIKNAMANSGQNFSFVPSSSSNPSSPKTLSPEQLQSIVSTRSQVGPSGQVTASVSGGNGGNVGGMNGGNVGGIGDGFGGRHFHHHWEHHRFERYFPRYDFDRGRR